MSTFRRKLAATIALSAVAALLFAGISSGAGAAHYAGKTSQKLRITLTVTGSSVTNLKFTIVDKCPRKRRLFVHDSGFPPIRITKGSFGGKFTAKSPSTATVSVSGHLAGRSVSGSVQDRTKSHKWHKFCSGRATFKLHRV